MWAGSRASQEKSEMVKQRRRVVEAVPAASKRPANEVFGSGTSKKPTEDDRVKRARHVQTLAEESRSVARLSNDLRVSFTSKISPSFKQQCNDLLKSTKVDKSKYTSLQQRSIATGHVKLFWKTDFYLLLRKPTSNEKVCFNAKNGQCIGTQLGTIGPLVATIGKKAVLKHDMNFGFCVACRVSRAQLAALGNMLSGQITEVVPTEPFGFHESLSVMVNSSGTDNEMEFMPGTTWNAPYTFDVPSRSGSCFGTVNHSPLLLDNLKPSADKTRYIPHGYEFVDGELQRKADNNVPNVAMTFF